MNDLENSIAIDFYRTLRNSDEAVNELYNQVTTVLNRRRARTQNEEIKAKKLLKALLANLFPQCFKLNSKHIVIKLDANEYRPSIYKPDFVTYKLLASLIKGLYKLDYISIRKGFYDRITNKGKRTRLTITDELREFLTGYDFKMTDIQSDYRARELVILKDKKRDLICYPPSEITEGMKSNLLMLNEFVRSSDINLNLTEEQTQALILTMTRNEEPRSLDLSRHVLYRVFNNSSFEQGGRFYGGWWQQIPSDYRKYITIDGEPTIEVDYSEIHPRLLYNHLIGMEVPFDDCYDVDGFGRLFRDEVKTYFNIMLNATDRQKTLAANESKFILPRCKSLQDLERALMVMHEPIASKFYTGAGLELMYHDSNIADSVMVSLARRGITCLPIHDSFIVKSSHCKELVSAMQQAYLEYTGFKAKLKLLETVLDVHDSLNNLDILVSANPLALSLATFHA